MHSKQGGRQSRLEWHGRHGRQDEHYRHSGRIAGIAAGKADLESMTDQTAGMAGKTSITGIVAGGHCSRQSRSGEHDRPDGRHRRQDEHYRYSGRIAGKAGLGGRAVKATVIASLDGITDKVADIAGARRAWRTK